MADAEDKEKAEKVAAARKRFEALKKQKAKKAAGKKEPDTKTDAEAKSIEAIDATTDVPADAAETRTTDDSGEGAVDDSQNITHPASERSKNDRKGSVGTTESKLRPESFRRGEMNTGPLSPSIEGDAVQDIYRKQVARIEQLEKDCKRLDKELEERQKALSRAEKEVEELHDKQGDMAVLKEKAARSDEAAEEAEKLRSEITSLQRQNSQLQSTAAAKRRTSTAPTPSPTLTDDLTSQLATKSSALEALELEISNLRHSLNTATTRITELETSLATTQSTADSATTELTTLRETLSTQSPSSQKPDQQSSPSPPTDPRITLLESDLRSAHLTAADATWRAASLEAKITTLTTLHRDAETRRAREAEKAASESATLRKRLAATMTPDDATGMEELEDEERRALSARVRELEGQIFDLKRGAYRDQKRGMQPGDRDEVDGDDGQDGALTSPSTRFDDVDLSTPGGARLRRGSRAGSGGVGAGGAANQYISAVAGGLSNVFNALTSPTRGPASYFPAAATQQDNGGAGLQEFTEEDEYGEDEDEFDEEAFRKAQEDAARVRIERVKETKRGLEKWRGWRVDLVEARGGLATGVFDV